MVLTMAPTCSVLHYQCVEVVELEFSFVILIPALKFFLSSLDQKMEKHSISAVLTEQRRALTKKSNNRVL